MTKDIQQTKKKNKNMNTKTKKRNHKQNTSLNYELSEILNELSVGQYARGEIFRARAYKNAADKILNIDPIYNINELEGVETFGTGILERLRLYIDNGTFPLLETIRNDPRVIISNIYGIGSKKANELVEKNNIKTISDLKKKLEKNPSLLNSKQKIGLQYYNDIVQKIPRKEIQKYENAFRTILPNNLTMEVVGSYRRGASKSGDIDVIFTHNDEKKGILLFKEFLERLKNHDYISAILASGRKKGMYILKLNKMKTHRRVDFLFTNKKEYPFAILYFTGSKYFNIHMRRYAMDMNISLNEKGMKNLTNNQQIDTSNIKTERDIFKYLGLKYIEPNNRIDGNNIIPISKN
jgi:DNA polymerase beta